MSFWLCEKNKHEKSDCFTNYRACQLSSHEGIVSSRSVRVCVCLHNSWIMPIRSWCNLTGICITMPLEVIRFQWHLTLIFNLDSHFSIFDGSAEGLRCPNGLLTLRATPRDARSCTQQSILYVVLRTDAAWRGMARNKAEKEASFRSNRPANCASIVLLIIMFLFFGEIKWWSIGMHLLYQLTEV